MTRPPSHAPPALARLKAEWLDAAAIVGASCALAISSICTGVVISELRPPVIVMTISAGTRCPMTKCSVTSAVASSAKPPYRVGRSARSVSGPATSVPSVMPTPNSASTRVVDPSEIPVRLVSIGTR